LEIAKLEIYQSLPKCEIHIQGCLIAEDGRHLKLNSNMVTIWARAMVKNQDFNIFKYYLLLIFIIFIE